MNYDMLFHSGVFVVAIRSPCKSV